MLAKQRASSERRMVPPFRTVRRTCRAQRALLQRRLDRQQFLVLATNLDRLVCECKRRRARDCAVDYNRRLSRVRCTSAVAVRRIRRTTAFPRRDGQQWVDSGVEGLLCVGFARERTK